MTSRNAWPIGWLLAVWLFSTGLTVFAADQVAVPPLQARVMDLTRTLSTAEAGSLEARLKAFEARKGSQIAVLIVPTTQPETIEQYGIRVADAWKLGRKGIDDGLILLVAKDDHALRIEVGYGLEGVVPDAVANRVIDETIVPRFKAGDFDGGIDAGVDQLIRLVDGEPLPPLAADRPRDSGDGGSFFMLLIPLVFVGRVLNGLFGALVGALVSACLGAIGGYVLGGPGMALVGGFLGLVFGASGFRGGSGYWGGGGGWSSGGGGFSGGGFSGGGGGFGGGGASGRW